MSRRVLRITGVLLLLGALIFLGIALTHPELGTAFTVFGVRIGASVWRGCYLAYLAVTALLLLLSFFVKKK